jgi:uncharacterized protein YgbK (DUF1537 family)
VPALPARSGGVLLVVGSLAEAARLQAEEVARGGAARRISVSSAALLAGPSAWAGASDGLCGLLGRGQDVLLEVAAEDRPDLGRGPELAARLAQLVEPAFPALGGLAATGGETAKALLERVGVHGIALLDEVEPGVPLGLTLGGRSLPVVTKAGGFGGPGTLLRCLERLRN